MKTKERKMIESALRAIDDKRYSRAKSTLLKVLGLIQVQPEIKSSYTFNSLSGKGIYWRDVPPVK